jgi:large subunit ribosomal protein L25
MAKEVELEVAPRTITGKATKRLRKAGIIPAHIFGHKEEPQTIQFSALEFSRLRRASTGASIIKLKLPDNVTQTAVLRYVQHNPKTGKVLHVDFLRVGMEEHIKFKLALHFVGEAPGVKIQGGVLLHLLEALEVESRASDMVDHVDVDISSLAEIDDILHAGDVKLPENYILLTDPAEPIVKVEATRAEVAAETAEAATAAPAAPATPASTEASENA